MNAPNTKQLMQNLLDSARRDGPSAAEKARIWEQVALAPPLSLVGAAATASMPPRALAAGAASTKALGGVAVAGVSAGKLLLAGALAGSVLASGVGVLVVRGLPHDRANVGSRGGDVQAATYAGATDHAASVPTREPLPRDIATQAGNDPTRNTSDHVLAPAARTVSAAPVGGVEPSAPPSPGRAAQARGQAANHDPDGHDLLTMREAALVSEARTAIVHGRAAAALELLDAVRRDGMHSMEPEELLLRVRALRMLGRETEAADVEKALRDRYPDSDLVQ